jgi:hypothetical protein
MRPSRERRDTTLPQRRPELECIRVHDLNEDEEYELTDDVLVVLE